MTDAVPTSQGVCAMGLGQKSWNGTDAAHSNGDAAREALTSDVRQGLTRAQKALPPKYFYDRYGSQLFEEITRLPEYYLTRTERRLLLKWMPELVQRYAPRSLLELGAGSGEKTRIILSAMRATHGSLAYLPLDISAEFLEESAGRLRDDFPELSIAPIVADLADAIVPPRTVARPMLFAFLGSTIGNFDRSEAIALLRRVRAAARPDDLFLLGADLHKDAARIERAYNDPRGVTAEFNRNVLRVLNRELGADFEVESFSHFAPYLADERRVEMHLVADSDQLVTVPGVGRVRFAAGESIRTEICCKYDRAQILDLLGAADFGIEEWWEDESEPYALVLARPAARVARLGGSVRAAWPGHAVVARLERDTREHLFALGCGSADDRRIGAEVEVLLVDAATRAPANIERSFAVLRRVAAAEGWNECRSLKAAMSEFRTQQTGRITFEPGGQLEYSAPPALSLSDLAKDLQDTVGRLTQALSDEGIACMSLGIDPRTPVEATMLQLDAERYRRMDRHFASIGKFGARMMRQTASLQICVDAGDDPYARFALLEAISPYVIAIFANSGFYEGTPTGHMSYRAHTWRSLDPSRTGLVCDGAEAAAAYTSFALGARTILTGPEHEAPQPFGEKLAAGRAQVGDWTTHLTTLFPEVRPRGYFELRSCDAVAPELYVAPLAFVAGLTYDAATARAARELLGPSNVGLLASAGRCGLLDPAVSANARDLWQLARAGCLALGSAFVDGPDLERVDEFIRQYTARGRSPVHDALDSNAL
ncbi:MAG: L-histidine N(alpha)-methyltransferase [Gemmatimonadaceae bacterium]